MDSWNLLLRIFTIYKTRLIWWISKLKTHYLKKKLIGGVIKQLKTIQNIILKIWANRGLFEDLLIGKLFTKSVTTKVGWSIKHVCYKMAWVAFIPIFNQQCEGGLQPCRLTVSKIVEDCLRGNILSPSCSGSLHDASKIYREAKSVDGGKQTNKPIRQKGAKFEESESSFWYWSR